MKKILITGIVTFAILAGVAYILQKSSGGDSDDVAYGYKDIAMNESGTRVSKEDVVTATPAVAKSGVVLVDDENNHYPIPAAYASLLNEESLDLLLSQADYGRSSVIALGIISGEKALIAITEAGPGITYAHIFSIDTTGAAKVIATSTSYDMYQNRTSLDGELITYVSREPVSGTGGSSAEHVMRYDFLNVVDKVNIFLVRNSTFYSIILPGNAQAFAKQQGMDANSWYGIINMVGGVRMGNTNTVEFVRYYAKQGADNNYTQVSDKELWSYDIATGKLTLLETIPLENMR